MEDKKTQAPDATERPVKPKRKYRYIGPAFKKGVYLPDATTLINPDTVAEADLEIYFTRFPTFRALFEETK